MTITELFQNTGNPLHYGLRFMRWDLGGKVWVVSERKPRKTMTTIIRTKDESIAVKNLFNLNHPDKENK